MTSSAPPIALKGNIELTESNVLQEKTNIEILGFLLILILLLEPPTQQHRADERTVPEMRKATTTVTACSMWKLPRTILAHR